MQHLFPQHEMLRVGRQLLHKVLPTVLSGPTLAGSAHLLHKAQVWASWPLLTESSRLSDDCSRPERPVRDLVEWGRQEEAWSCALSAWTSQLAADGLRAS